MLAGLLYFENYNYNILNQNDNSPFDILWSLAVEEHFYLVFPLLFVGLARRPGRLLAACGMLAALSLGLRLCGITFGWAELHTWVVWRGTSWRTVRQSPSAKSAIRYTCGLTTGH